MKKSRRLLLLGVVLFVPFLAALSRAPARTIEGQTHRVPYRISETMHMVIRAKFNGKGPFNFIVDTGAPTMFVTNHVAKTVGVERADNGWAKFDRMEIEGGPTLENVRAIVEDIFQIRGMNGLGLPGVRLDGVIGYTVLAKFRMEFDLAESSLKWEQLEFDPPLPRPLGGEDGKRGASAPPELEAMGGLVQLAGSMFGRGAAEPAVERGFLGVTFESPRPQTKSNDANDATPPDSPGVRIKAVLADSPAAIAGVKPSDVITHFSGKSVRSPADVVRLANELPVGTEIHLVIERGESELKFTAKTGRGL